LGPFANIVGIDINPACKASEEGQISVCIGDQADTGFLQDIIDKYGCPDVVLDDGSHEMNRTRKTFEFLYGKVSKNGVYMVEDTHTSYWPKFGGGLQEENTFIEFSKSLIDALNARHFEASPDFANVTNSISFYDSIVVFEKIQWTKDSLKSMITP
jgi:hypothetical protein